MSEKKSLRECCDEREYGDDVIVFCKGVVVIQALQVICELGLDTRKGTSRIMNLAEIFHTWQSFGISLIDFMSAYIMQNNPHEPKLLQLINALSMPQRGSRFVLTFCRTSCLWSVGSSGRFESGMVRMLLVEVVVWFWF